MSNLKKRQHYVWRHYLRPWANNESIWTYFKEQDKIVKPSLMGVAQEKYYYKLEDFTDKEISFLKNFVDKTSPPVLKGLNSDFLTLFTSSSILKRQLAANTNPKVNSEFVASEIKKIEANSMEDAHCIMENLGSRVIQCRSIEDLKELNKNDNLFDAIMFLSIQYFRTKSMRKSVLTSFNGDKFEGLAEKSWNIISFVMATILARNISLDRKLRFTFIENNTTIPFITGDQPVFNILNDKLNEQGEVIELELYYPLTPNCAIYLHFRPEQEDQYEGKTADENYVNYLNKKVFDNADYYVFANNEKILEQVK
ncbi:MAG: DUF4238 domain-containing protein [Bacteroidales bacterium]|nr:DUF4238 domain-containing protein [Bacteroidales bacterium]